jgi:hypothetical protein
MHKINTITKNVNLFIIFQFCLLSFQLVSLLMVSNLFIAVTKLHNISKLFCNIFIFSHQKNYCSVLMFASNSLIHATSHSFSKKISDAHRYKDTKFCRYMRFFFDFHTLTSARLRQTALCAAICHIIFLNYIILNSHNRYKQQDNFW